MGAEDLSDFRPPYTLGALGCVVVGVWRGRTEPVARALSGFEPVPWRGGFLGVALVLRYDRPPVQRPIAYSELIASYTLRRGARWAAMPFDLVLDDEFLVRAGQHHYHLPKRLDPTFRIELVRDRHGAPEQMIAAGSDVAFEARLGSSRFSPANRIVASVFHALTEHGAIVGTSEAPAIWTSIPVRPDAATRRSVRSARIEVGAHTLEPVHSQFWSAMDITVSAPHEALFGGSSRVG